MRDLFSTGSNVLWYALCALVFGVVLLITKRIFEKWVFWKELIRDIGIAFIVAAVVSVVYEASTRSVGMIDFLNKVMGSYVPENLWAEVNNEVLHRNVLRRNVEIRLKIMRDGVLEDGQKISLPKGQAVLWMEYGYDLYGLTAGGSTVTVQHSLDFQMWDEKTQLPRFERVWIIKPGAAKPILYERTDLKEKKIDDGQGTVTLENENGVALPSPSKKVPVRIITQRYEIVNTPGAYTVVTPELIVGVPDLAYPTIKVSVEALPPDIEVDIDTYGSPHEFTQAPNNKTVWTYDGIMLPGQAITIILKIRR